MKKFDGILICTDLDGTLLGNDKTVSKKNINAIEYFKNEGGKFTFVTGRMPFFSAEAVEAARPNAPFGCINGGGVYDYAARKYLWKRELTRSVMELVRYIDERVPEIGIQVNTFDKVYFCRENESMAEFRKITGVENTVRDYDDVDEPVAKIVFGDKNSDKIDTVKRLLAEHPRADEFDFIGSEKSLFEILPKGIGKGNALLKIAEVLGIEKDRTVAIGDYDNDISMVSAAKLGVAVANASPDLKAVADFVTVSNEEDAVAKLIYDIESGALKL